MAIKNLKVRILEETNRIITEEGFDNFSVRSLSARLNVSHNALYRHFKSKTHLLFALLREGFSHMNNAFRLLSERDDMDLVAKLKECVCIYVEFAVNNPNVYRIMYVSEDMKDEIPDSLIETYRNNYSDVLIIIEKCFSEGIIETGTPLSVNNTIWAYAHGLSSMLIDNILPMAIDLDNMPTLLIMEGCLPENNTRDVIMFSVETFIESLLA